MTGESTILLYVVDLMIFCDDDESLLAIIQAIQEKYKEISYDIGPNHSYLGMTFSFENEEVKISMWIHSKPYQRKLRDREIDHSCWHRLI